jgi:hypothetical protein
VSPRRNRPAAGAKDVDEPAIYSGIESVEFDVDGEEWVVRRVSGASAAAGKAYRCPGCDQEIPPSTPHVVAWVRHSIDGRRHWHTPCWDARKRRVAKVRKPGR